MNDSLQCAVRIATEAADVAMAGFRSGTPISKKGVIDLLTEYDLRTEEFIRQELARHFPTDAIVGEEGGSDSGAEQSGEPLWYVDPIDGTTNFAHGHPFFCVSRARWAECRGQLGVVRMRFCHL